MPNLYHDDQARRRPTLAPGEFLGSKRLLRSQAGWQAYEATYQPSFQCGMHDHERAALCMVLAGDYQEIANNRSIDVSAGAIVQQPAGNHHADRHGDRTVELLIVEFEPDSFARPAGLTEALGERAFRSDAITTQIVARLRRELEATDAAAALACEALILETVVALARTERLPRDRAPAWLQRLEDRIRDFTMPPASLAELASEVGLHPAHLARAFRQHHGRSIGEHRRRVMVEEALRQIQHTDLPLAAIAASVGFADQSHMTRLFTASLGQPPAKFRKVSARRGDDRRSRRTFRIVYPAGCQIGGSRRSPEPRTCGITKRSGYGRSP